MRREFFWPTCRLAVLPTSSRLLDPSTARLALARFPYLFTGPAAGPGGRDEGVGRGSALGDLHFDEVFDLEATVPQQADHFPVGQVKLGRAVPPVEAVHAEERPLQALRRRKIFIAHWRRQHQEERVAEEVEPAAGTEDPGRLRDPEVGIAPDRRPVFADGEVEAFICKRSLLGV